MSLSTVYANEVAYVSNRGYRNTTRRPTSYSGSNSRIDADFENKFRPAARPVKTDAHTPVKVPEG